MSEEISQSWSEWTNGDARREHFLQRNEKIQSSLRRIKELAIKGTLKGTNLAQTVRAAESELKALEQWARIVKLDLREKSESRRLDSAAAIMEFVAEFHQVLNVAMNDLQERQPEEYAKVKGEMGRSRPDAGGGR